MHGCLERLNAVLHRRYILLQNVDAILNFSVRVSDVVFELLDGILYVSVRFFDVDFELLPHRSHSSIN